MIFFKVYCAHPLYSTTVSHRSPLSDMLFTRFDSANVPAWICIAILKIDLIYVFKIQSVLLVGPIYPDIDRVDRVDLRSDPAK